MSVAGVASSRKLQHHARGVGLGPLVFGVSVVFERFANCSLKSGKVYLKAHGSP
jgi:hypothetical protein